ncbi:uncharacterized protein CBL_20938 [Carabus blaptoides fortunei]
MDTALVTYHPQQAHVKLMVTPVHRFQSVDCVTANSARHHHHLHHQLQHLGGSTSVRGNNRQLTQAVQCQHAQSPATAPAYSAHHTRSASNAQHTGAHSMELDSGVFLDVPLEAPPPGARPAGPHEATGPAGPGHHHHHVLPAGKLKCGMWASFAIVTVFMAGAKFYFNNQSTGMEVLIFCSLLVVVLFAGCTVSLCEAVTAAPPATTAVMDTIHVPPVHPQDVESSTQASTEDLSVLGLQVPPSQPMMIHNQPEPPPPPYHIAVLLPQQQQRLRHHQSQQQIIDDSPPPSYDKAVS